MHDGFELVDPLSAQAFLREFDAESRRYGEGLVRIGAVETTNVKRPGLEYEGTVRDGEKYDVSVYVNNLPAGQVAWDGDCTCPKEFDCPHVFALMREVLAQHSAARVRKLSAGSPPSSPAKRRKPGKGTPVEEGERLAERLRTALARP